MAAHAEAINADNAAVTKKKFRSARGDIEQFRRASMLYSLDRLSAADTELPRKYRSPDMASEGRLAAIS